VYTASLKYGDKSSKTEFKILPNPLYPTSAESYSEYHNFMTTMEETLTIMHKKVNEIMKTRKQIEEILKDLPDDNKFGAIRKQGGDLVKKMKAWDEDMIQRKSKAYDDVENFPNKFTANYLFLINQTESDIPKVNKASRDRFDELSKEWNTLDARAKEIMETDVPAYTRQLWDNGIGAVRVMSR
jgi:hypothetical protein